MNLLNKNIHDITYDEVVDFCKNKVLEGTQLDYKLKVPKDLAKHFATFSNTQGGLIIIGVGEDSKGLPTTYSGVQNDGKLTDQIHQFAANVTPLPTYDVCTTSEKSGKVFMLIRISEGAAAPYTTLNDPTVWVRNGNISTPASREELLRLANKRKDARELRESNLAFANLYFDARVNEAEEERKGLIQAGKEGVYKHALNGIHCAVMSIALQPYYPNVQLATTQELYDKQHDFMGRKYVNTIFNYVRADSMPGALTAFSWKESSGVIHNDQLYANGLVFSASDVLEHNGVQSLITLYSVGAKLFSQLKIIQAYYKQTGYTGLIEGCIVLNGGVGAAVRPIGSPNHTTFIPDPGKVRLKSYSWPLHFDTNKLFDDVELSELFGKALQDISWGLGIPDLPDSVLEGYLTYNGYKPKRNQ